MTLRELLNALKGHNDSEHWHWLQGWRQARFVAFSAIKPYLENKHANPEDILPLPEDVDRRSEMAKNYKENYERLKNKLPDRIGTSETR